MRMHKQHDESLSRGTDAAMSALYRFLDAKNHLVNSAESAGMQMKHEARDRLLRSRRKLHRGRQNLEHLGHEAVHHTKRKPLAVAGIAIIGGLILYRVLGRR